MSKSLTHFRLAVNPSSLYSLPPPLLQQFSTGCWTHKYDTISCDVWRRVMHHAHTQLRSIYITFYAHESVLYLSQNWDEKKIENSFLTVLISVQSWIISYKFHIWELQCEENEIVSSENEIVSNGFLLYSVMISFVLFTYF